MEFSNSEYWSGQPFCSPGDLPNPGIELRPPSLQANSLPTELSGKPNYLLKDFFFFNVQEAESYQEVLNPIGFF